MSQESEMISHYSAIRQRLRLPHNAVPDKGIDLHPTRIPITALSSEEILEVLECRSPVHCRISIQIVPKPPIEPVKPRKVTMVAVERAVCRVFAIAPHDLKGRCRQEWVLRPGR